MSARTGRPRTPRLVSNPLAKAVIPLICRCRMRDSNYVLRFVGDHYGPLWQLTGRGYRRRPTLRMHPRWKRFLEFFGGLEEFTTPKGDRFLFSFRGRERWAKFGK